MPTSDANALLLTVSADTNKLVKAMEKASGTVTTHTRKMEAELTGLEKFFGKTSIPRAMDKVFDSTRFKVLDSGVARVGIFGSALEALGPAGLTAAAGVAAFGLAVNQALKTAEWADQLQETAQKLGITTTQLQEFDFVAKQADIPIDAMRESLQHLNATIGDIKTGLARTRVRSAFTDLLHIDVEDVRRLGDVEHVLPVILENAAKLSSAGRAAVAKALKIDPGVLNGLIDARDRLGDLIAEAHKYGIVVDADIIRKSAEAAEKLKLASDIIDKNLKVAFADLAGPIAEATLALAKFIHLLATLPTTHPKFAEIIGHVVAGAAGVVAGPIAQSTVEAIFGASRLPKPVTMEEMLGRLKGTPTGVDPTVAVKGRTRRGPTDNTASATARINALLADANAKLLSALAELTDNVQQRADIEHKVLLAEGQKEADRITAEEEKIKADKGLSDATKAALIAKLEETRLTDLSAAIAKDQLAARNTAWKIKDGQIDLHKAITEAMLNQLQAEADIATTADERNRIETRILQIRQQLERDLEGSRLDRQVQSGEISPEERDRRMAALGQTQGADRLTFAAGHQSPVEQYLHSIQDLNTEMQDAGVNAAQSLADGLANAIVNAQSLGQVASNVFRQLIAQILSAVLQQNVTGPILSSIFGIPAHASGTSFAPGGLSLVGERGPELVRLPTGSQVMTAAQTRAALSIAPGGRGGVFAPVFDFRGAVVTQDLLDQANATAARLAKIAGDNAVARSMVLGRKTLPGVLRSNALLHA